MRPLDWCLALIPLLLAVSRGEIEAGAATFIARGWGEREVNHLDDGTVVGHQNFNETALDQNTATAREKNLVIPTQQTDSNGRV